MGTSGVLKGVKWVLEGYTTGYSRLAHLQRQRARLEDRRAERCAEGDAVEPACAPLENRVSAPRVPCEYPKSTV
jgi:hypothetical protein